MKKVYRFLIGLHWFVGIGAMFGGLAAVINPETPLGITVDALKKSPFTSYLIPGLILLIIIGFGNIFAAIMIHKKSRFSAYSSSIPGWALVIWIVVQCIMLQAVAPPHVLFFVIGLIQAILAAVVLFEQKLFPANIAIKMYEGIKREV